MAKTFIFPVQCRQSRWAPSVVEPSLDLKELVFRYVCALCNIGSLLILALLSALGSQRLLNHRSRFKREGVVHGSLRHSACRRTLSSFGTCRRSFGALTHETQPLQHQHQCGGSTCFISRWKFALPLNRHLICISNVNISAHHSTHHRFISL